MNKINNLAELKKEAIAITSVCRVTWPQFGNSQETYTFKYSPDLENCYEMNNGTIAFVSESILYVIPHTHTIMTILRRNGFVNKGMYVPFSNWDFPTDYKDHWEKLHEMQQEERKLNFIRDCEKYSDENGFGTLSAEMLEKCFLMPSSGVHVKHPYFETVHMPVLETYFFDCTVTSKLGRYCTNNGTCVFVYRDGNTYVTRNWDVVFALREAGYLEEGLYVPFSNGESIVDPVLATRWEICKKK